MAETNIIHITKGTHIENVLAQAIMDFQQKEMKATTWTWLDKWCANIIREAVFARLHPMGGHNYTGNLINSIVVILYMKKGGSKEKSTYFASSVSGKPAIMRELSALNARGRRRQYNIHFRPGSKFAERDWSGEWSTLRADSLIPTDGSYGASDAIKFAHNWRPVTGADFEICVAYTAEYASWVEQERASTGYLEVLDFVDRTAIQWIGLK